jgi:diketogulonate reductase-like aldo/keto reductase
MAKLRIGRREFTQGCAALGCALPLARAAWAAEASAPAGETAPIAERTVRLPDGREVPALGQGAWHLGQGRHTAAVETEAMQAGISAGMTLIDTSGNYGHGRSEQFLGPVIAAERKRIFLVSKVEGDEVDGDGIARACAASLARLATPYLDLYLMHWPPPNSKFAGMVAAFEQLRAAGRIRAWGVSNFDRAQMEALFKVPDGQRCATNQVEYSLRDRSIERDVLPWCVEHGVPVMAYSPLGGDKNLLVRDPTLAKIGAAHGCTAAAVALAWVIRGGHVIAIPEAGTPEHVRANAAALSVSLAPEEITLLERAFPLG